MNTFKRFNSYQNGRFFWIFLALFCATLLFIAHFIFQIYLFMPPCEQCVYIRFAFICIGFGAIITSLNPKNIFIKLIGLAFGFFGCIKGTMYAYKLHLIHEAILTEDPFGLEGCAEIPTFPFGLPLDKWSPSWFAPAGDCGYDNPVIPDGEKLDFLQSWLTNFYGDGWYILPSYHFGNMAQVCLVVFVCIFVVLSISLISSRVKNTK